MNRTQEKYEKNVYTFQLICDLLTYYVDVPRILVLSEEENVSNELNVSFAGYYPTWIKLDFWDFFVETDEDANILLFKIAFEVGLSYAVKLNISCNYDDREDHCDAYDRECELCRPYYNNTFALVFAKYICRETYNELPSQLRCPQAYCVNSIYDEKDMQELLKNELRENRKLPYLFEWINEMFDYAIYF